ncbi:MAG: hypothetical protein J0H67_19065 [Rhodospirillales bacterium]|nr:hypothetical protein [Rhodospirillales bacterium]MBN8896854.1 hypothetical protein [Rhodospirillales bacterium]
MPGSDPQTTAQSIIRLHGLRAQAVATERLNEARLAGDTLALERWQAVHVALRELRNTAPAEAGER